MQLGGTRINLQVSSYTYLFFMTYMCVLQIERQLFNVTGTLACVTKFGFFKDDLGGIVPL